MSETPKNSMKSAAKNVLIIAAFAALAVQAARAQDIKLNVTYVCNGERMYVESCNIRDLSDTATCQVAHPDRPQHNGFMAYTTETRGTLKKLLPTCTQPTAAEIAKEEAFQKKLQENYAAAVAKANPQRGSARAPARRRRRCAGGAELSDARAAEECRRARDAALRKLGKAAVDVHGQLAAGDVRQHDFAGFAAARIRRPRRDRRWRACIEGAGSWRLDFIDGGVLVNCSFLSPNQESYRPGP